MTSRLQSTLMHALLLVGLLASCVVLYVAGIAEPVPPQDEGILLTYPDLITRGFLPYRDFAALYMPGTFYAVAAAFKAFGASLSVERAVGGAYWLSLVLSMYAVGRRVAPWTGLLAAALCLEATSSFGAGAYAMIPAEAAALLALACAAGGSSAWSGILAVGALWFRQDVGAIATVTLLLLHMAFLRQRLGAFMAGAALCGVPMLALFSWIGWDAVLQSVVLDVLRNGPGRRLPLTPGGDLVVLVCTAMVNAACAVVAVARKLDARDRVLCCGAGLLSLGVLPSVLQRADTWHVSYALGLVAGLAVVAMSVLFRALDARLGWMRKLAPLSVAAWLLLIWGELPQARQAWTAAPPLVVSGERQLPALGAGQRAAMQGLVDALNELPAGHRVFVGPVDLRFTHYNDSQLYFLWPHLVPASRYIEMNPGVANREGSGLAGEIAAADVVVLTTSYERHREPNASSVPGSVAANEVLRREFRPWKQFGPWRVLRRAEASGRLAELQ